MYLHLKQLNYLPTYLMHDSKIIYYSNHVMYSRIWILDILYFHSMKQLHDVWLNLVRFYTQPLQIKSVVAVEGLKGYIYIESYKQQFVKQAIEDIGNLRIGKWQQLMVPIKEMTDVLRVVKDTTGIKRGSWVRIKRSVYKDDIAQVGVACVAITTNSTI